MENKRFNTEHINADILSVLELSSKIGWKETRELSIVRILYLSSLLYSFMYPDRHNPFEDDYEFTVDSRGPYNDIIINNSLVYLLTNDFVYENEEEKSYSIGKREIFDIDQIPKYSEKRHWIDIIIHILGIYGEDNIYDFIFRDPEYKDNISRQSAKTLNITYTNKTIETLKNFQAAFVKSLGDKAKELSDKDYLEMYFEFIFSKYLKGQKI